MHSAGFASDRNHLATIGTGVFLAKFVGLLFQEGSESALGQAASGFLGDLFESGEVDAQTGSFLTVGPARDDFSPLRGQITDISEILGVQRLARHCLGILALADINAEARILLFYTKALFIAKPVLTST
jgi:hypothetical protein